MFVELAEFLRCTGDHEETYLVLTPDTILDRAVQSGQIGCPTCNREFTIVDRVADFLPPDVPRPSPVPSLEPPAVAGETVQALLGITGAGGYVVLVGSAAYLGRPLAELDVGVHFVGVNAPADVLPATHLSIVRGHDRIPLRSSMARSVVIGPEYAREPWLNESVRVLLKGLRMIVLTDVEAIEGINPLAAAKGLWVGEKC